MFNPSMPSSVQHSFARVPQADIPRSSFQRNFSHKTTFNAGYLVPVYCDEVLPGDTFNAQMTGFARLSTPIVPYMDNAYMDSFFFYVPLRLLWPNFQRFMGEQPAPGDSTDFLVPQITAPEGGVQPMSLSDYIGIPILKAGLKFDAFWHRAYNLIYNEWFRDENLQNPVWQAFGDGPDDYSNFNLLRRGKRKDYFTGCLPWPQKGPAVDLPLTGNAPVVSTGENIKLHGATSNKTAEMSYGSSAPPHLGVSGVAFTNDEKIQFGDVTGLQADMSDVAGATINQLRMAFQIQRLYERDARGGTRYIELIRSHFGVISPDARLQRSEYLGGSSTPVNINPIAQTSATQADIDTPQANLAAVGTALLEPHKGHGFVRSFVEHGVVIGLVSVRADLTYQQGLPRMFSRQTRWDFFWPALAHIGEQAVKNKEIFAQNLPIDDEAFGFQEAWAEYRYKPSQLSGLMRSDAPLSLDVWNLSQDFSALPLLNSAFITENPPFERVVAVPSEPHFIFDSFFNIRCARPMPVYSVPGLIDHF